MEGLVRRMGDFGRFIEAASFSHGAQPNISNVARDCQERRKTVEGYFAILEDLQDLLRAFRQEYPEARTCLLYRGDDHLLINGIPCTPVSDFLGRLHRTTRFCMYPPMPRSTVPLDSPSLHSLLPMQHYRCRSDILIRCNKVIRCSSDLPAVT